MRKPSRPAYRRFLLSGYWKRVRAQVLKRDRYCCQDCSRRQFLQVHHITYAHHGHEDGHLEDLVTLCKTCHKKRHAKKAQ